MSIEGIILIVVCLFLIFTILANFGLTSKLEKEVLLLTRNINWAVDEIEKLKKVVAKLNYTSNLSEPLPDQEEFYEDLRDEWLRVSDEMYEIENRSIGKIKESERNNLILKWILLRRGWKG